MNLEQISKQSHRRPESVLIVVHASDGKTLLLKRTPPRSFWQSVTGSVHWHGETKIHAAIRELREETGIEAESSDFRDWNRSFKYPIPFEYQHRYEEGTRINREHVFSILVPSAIPVTLQRSEHSEFSWVGIEKAQEIVWSWSNREALVMVSQTMADIRD